MGGDALNDFPSSQPKYTHWGRWHRLSIGNYYGRDGKYLTFIVGSTCDIPDIEFIDPSLKKQPVVEDVPVSLTSGKDKKISYLIISSIEDLKTEHNFIPICF